VTSSSRRVHRCLKVPGSKGRKRNNRTSNEPLAKEVRVVLLHVARTVAYDTYQALIVFEDRNRLIEGLRESFKQGSNVHFAGSYRLCDPVGNHKQRIQTMTHEIWKATGYRFTYAS
jgi:hypothetical protein